MPVYEFRCNSCLKKSSFLVRGSRQAPVCSNCGGQDMKRVISACAYHRSESSRQGELGDCLSGSDSYQDPRNIGRWAEKRLGDAGMEVPPHLREMIDRARDGEMPAPIQDL
ncbi:MAG: FmdB family zinc ribbon protein [Chloroflexota bacterium]